MRKIAGAIKTASLAFGLVPVCITVSLADDQLARDMYYQQLNEPTRQSNTGFRYWIELQRKGSTLRVSNRQRFRSGDRIKFHIISNIDGYAHIVLVGGSTGARSILFPVAGKDQSNAVRRGRECTIPSTSFLQFDNNRGSEHIQVALSRKNLSSAELLRSGTEPRAVIPSSGTPATTHGDLKVSFEENKPGAGQSSDDTSIANAIPDDDYSRDLFRTQPVAHRPRPAYHAPIFTPYTTVVNTNPSKDLYADISLDHD